MFDNLKVGIIGGGQLGAMLLRYAIDYGIEAAILDKDPNAPCSRYSGSFKVGDPMSYDDVVNFGRNLDVVTIEMEAVNADALKALKENGVKVFPSPDTLETIQDKYVQKQFLKKHDIPVVNGWLVKNKAELEGYTAKLPACLKKCTDGYDGKGVMMLRTAEDITRAFDGPYVLEEIVDIEKEISVIVSRDEAGNIECYDPVMMMFDKELMLLDFQVCPGDLDDGVAADVRNLAKSVAKALNLIGIVAVEMFIASDGKVYVNELAPRPHNSGHHSIEACATSQFEQLIRVMLGLPLGSTETLMPSVMVNILEPVADKRQTVMNALKAALSDKDIHLHWYGKTSGKVGRKMGHITITNSKIEDAISKSVKIKQLIKG